MFLGVVVLGAAHAIIFPMPRHAGVGRCDVGASLGCIPIWHSLKGAPLVYTSPSTIVLLLVTCKKDVNIWKKGLGHMGGPQF